jgi:hypothetical protein
MKYNCDARADRRKAKELAYMAFIRQWHTKFAWWPIKLAHGDCRWLETIERRRVEVNSMYYGWDWKWEYRARG